MEVVSVHHAKTNLSRLIERALAGREVVIARGKDPVVRLVPILRPRPKRQFGTMKGRARVSAAFFKPLSRTELDRWHGRS
jgi:antitoxin (DNA-binding transcriptional repressor) of toxin-antitoxin stability system